MHSRKGNNLVWMEGEMYGGRRRNEAKMVVAVVVVMVRKIVKDLIIIVLPVNINQKKEF